MVGRISFGLFLEELCRLQQENKQKTAKFHPTSRFLPSLTPISARLSSTPSKSNRRNVKAQFRFTFRPGNHQAPKPHIWKLIRYSLVQTQRSSLEDLGASSSGDRVVLYSLSLICSFWAVVEAHNLADFNEDHLLPVLTLRNYLRHLKHLNCFLPLVQDYRTLVGR